MINQKKKMNGETYQINTNITNYHENPDYLGVDFKDSYYESNLIAELEINGHEVYN